MGILNVTPDSFSDAGRFFGFDDAFAAGMRMVDEGADLIDVGGESTRPGSEAVDVQEELRRTTAIVEALAKRAVSVSIDTMKPEVAAAALDVGAILVNDVSGLRNPRMLELVQTREPWVCIMHMRGEPKTMQLNPSYRDVVSEVRDYLVQIARDLPLPKEKVWIDPGIGFGKSTAHNLELIHGIGRFAATGYPVLVGVSRKSFIGRILGSDSSPLPVEERLEGSLALQTVAQLLGARALRVHDVREARRTIDMVAAFMSARPSSSSTFPV